MTLPSAGTKDPAPRPYPAPTIPTYIALVLRQGQADAIPVLLGDAATVDELIARWRTETVAWLSRAPGAPNSAERRLRAIGDELRRRAWDPIATHLEGVEQVFVVPDGALNLLPLAALPVGTTEYLLERDRRFITCRRRGIRQHRLRCNRERAAGAWRSLVPGCRPVHKTGKTWSEHVTFRRSGARERSSGGGWRGAAPKQRKRFEVQCPIAWVSSH